ncbi:ATP-dependent DNA helicase PIF1 [Rhizoctonia solani]|uniref:ATP-dependent DNA helicase PIF1 n=1 Tax=Rhizoctonia solani TaxID=456999 RepID=A0A8H8NRA5_9AGAM|nr:ATP-dependent DNA helicase PIF1 [Rhizoctonia solani]QRW17347.1 ATP-dependent DNA helicase PIF1 [Rhizoctonia solani]
MSGYSAQDGHRLLPHHPDSPSHNPMCTLVVACEINKKTHPITCREENVPTAQCSASTLSSTVDGGILLRSFMPRQPKSLVNDRFEDKGHVSIEYGAKWQKLQHLVMYGILQMHSTTFDALENTARTVGSRKEAYVGIQMIAVGDIFQLPPGSADVAAPDYAFIHTPWSATFSGQLDGDFSGDSCKPSWLAELVGMLNQTRTEKLPAKGKSCAGLLGCPIPTTYVEMC